MRVGWTYSRDDIHGGHGINDREENFPGNPRRLCRHEIKAQGVGFESSVSTDDKTLNFNLEMMIGTFSVWGASLTRWI
jgi:hypothetical protein